jgi:hypothetical protein
MGRSFYTDALELRIHALCVNSFIGDEWARVKYNFPHKIEGSILFQLNFATQICPRLDHIFIRMGPVQPFSCLLHCLVFLPAHVWEFSHVGNQCDNTLSLKP